jgi:hypothetical protein
VPFVAEDAAFTARFPVNPTRAEQVVGDRTLIYYSVELDDKVLGVIFFDFSDVGTIAADVIIDEAVNSIADTIGGELIFERRITYLGSPAVDGRIKIDGDMEHVRVVVIDGTRVYALIQVAVPIAGRTNDYRALLETFQPLAVDQGRVNAPKPA